MLFSLLPFFYHPRYTQFSHPHHVNTCYNTKHHRLTTSMWIVQGPPGHTLYITELLPGSRHYSTKMAILQKIHPSRDVKPDFLDPVNSTTTWTILTQYCHTQRLDVSHCVMKATGNPCARLHSNGFLVQATIRSTNLRYVVDHAHVVTLACMSMYSDISKHTRKGTGCRF
jgi:hypothetical protein